MHVQTVLDCLEIYCNWFNVTLCLNALPKVVVCTLIVGIRSSRLLKETFCEL